MDLNTLYQGTVTGWTEHVRRVRREQWADPTPCGEWTVRDLVNHVAGEDRWTPYLMSGHTVEDVGDRLAGDLLGEDPVGAATGAAKVAVRTVAELLPGGGTVMLSYGEESMGEYVRQLAADHLVHGWDLAVATGGDRRLDPALVREVADWFADREALYRQGGAIGPRHPGGGEDPQSVLIASFGRDPDWQPPG
jgi:uncharacterized protein (TIGR03086 family)